jgi:hypothetical protein
MFEPELFEFQHADEYQSFSFPDGIESKRLRFILTEKYADDMSTGGESAGQISRIYSLSVLNHRGEKGLPFSNSALDLISTVFLLGSYTNPFFQLAVLLPLARNWLGAGSGAELETDKRSLLDIANDDTEARNG